MLRRPCPAPLAHRPLHQPRPQEGPRGPGTKITYEKFTLISLIFNLSHSMPFSQEIKEYRTQPDAQQT